MYDLEALLAGHPGPAPRGHPGPAPRGRPRHPAALALPPAPPLVPAAVAPAQGAGRTAASTRACSPARHHPLPVGAAAPEPPAPSPPERGGPGRGARHDQRGGRGPARPSRQRDDHGPAGSDLGWPPRGHPCSPGSLSPPGGRDGPSPTSSPAGAALMGLLPRQLGGGVGLQHQPGGMDRRAGAAGT